MKNQITIREANSKPDTAAFWEQLHSYHERDIFPNPKDESLKHFLNDAEYRAQIEHVHNRPQDNCYYLFFQRNGQDIGFALPVIFTSEDGKCFIMEFCVYPEFRGNGTGRACAAVLLDWAKARGARYAELNYGGDERRLRFWRRIGFVENGVDEWGEPLMLLPPAEAVPFTVELLNDPTDWQLLKLENGFKREIGEETLIKFQQKQLQQAVREGRITFFMAKRGYRAVGMCSVAAYYSTFSCSNTGVYEDFYIEPAFRGKGIARMLARAAQNWCRENGITSLTVLRAMRQCTRRWGFIPALGQLSHIRNNKLSRQCIALAVYCLRFNFYSFSLERGLASAAIFLSVFSMCV